MPEYFAKIKYITDTQALAGKPIKLNDFIMHVLFEVDSSNYESLVTVVLAREEKITIDELSSLLLSHENRIEQKKGKLASDVIHNMTPNVAQKGSYSSKNNGVFQKNFRGANNFSFGGFNGGFNANSGLGQFNGVGNPLDIICQICFTPGHGAIRCKNKFNASFVPQRHYGRGNFNGGFRPEEEQYGRGPLWLWQRRWT